MDSRAPAVSARVRVALTTPYDSAAAAAALDTLAGMYADTGTPHLPTLRARVASDTQAAANAATHAFIRELEALDSAHAAVSATASAMQRECSAVADSLDAAAAAAATLGAHAAALEDQRCVYTNQRARCGAAVACRGHACASHALS